MRRKIELRKGRKDAKPRENRIEEDTKIQQNKKTKNEGRKIK